MRVFPIAAMVCAFVAGLAPAAGAGEDPFQVLNVTKAVEGTPPAGAEFVVEVACEGPSGPTESGTLTFAGPDTQVFDAGGESLECTVTETGNAGAAVSYSCEAISAAQCAAAGNAVTYTSDVAEATVTVTNTFAAAPPPNVTVEPTPAPAPAVLAQPALTG